MTVRLRPHHLLCMLTYVGKGYSQAFTGNYDAIARRLTAGEEILIVEGPDDICAPLLADHRPHCWNESVTDRDRQAARDVGARLAMPIVPGATLHLSPLLLSGLRGAFARNETRAACLGCEWTALCDGIAAGRFEGTRIRPPS